MKSIKFAFLLAALFLFEGISIHGFAMPHSWNRLTDSDFKSKFGKLEFKDKILEWANYIETPCSRRSKGPDRALLMSNIIGANIEGSNKDNKDRLIIFFQTVVGLDEKKIEGLLEHLSRTNRHQTMVSFDQKELPLREAFNNWNTKRNTRHSTDSSFYSLECLKRTKFAHNDFRYQIQLIIDQDRPKIFLLHPGLQNHREPLFFDPFSSAQDDPSPQWPWPCSSQKLHAEGLDLNFRNGGKFNLTKEGILTFTWAKGNDRIALLSSKPIFLEGDGEIWVEAPSVSGRTQSLWLAPPPEGTDLVHTVTVDKMHFMRGIFRNRGVLGSPEKLGVIIHGEASNILWDMDHSQNLGTVKAPSVEISHLPGPKSKLIAFEEGRIEASDICLIGTAMHLKGVDVTCNNLSLSYLSEFGCDRTVNSLKTLFFLKGIAPGFKLTLPLVADGFIEFWEDCLDMKPANADCKMKNRFGENYDQKAPSSYSIEILASIKSQGLKFYTPEAKIFAGTQQNMIDIVLENNLVIYCSEFLAPGIRALFKTGSIKAPVGINVGKLLEDPIKKVHLELSTSLPKIPQKIFSRILNVPLLTTNGAGLAATSALHLWGPLKSSGHIMADTMVHHFHQDSIIESGRVEVQKIILAGLGQWRLRPGTKDLDLAMVVRYHRGKGGSDNPTVSCRWAGELPVAERPILTCQDIKTKGPVLVNEGGILSVTDQTVPHFLSFESYPFKLPSGVSTRIMTPEEVSDLERQPYLWRCGPDQDWWSKWEFYTVFLNGRKVMSEHVLGSEKQPFLRSHDNRFDPVYIDNYSQSIPRTVYFWGTGPRSREVGEFPQLVVSTEPFSGFMRELASSSHFEGNTAFVKKGAVLLGIQVTNGVLTVEDPGSVGSSL